MRKRMRTWGTALFIFSLLGFVSGCGSGSGGASADPMFGDIPVEKVPDGNTQAYLQAFNLRAADGSLSPPIEPQTGTAPFAAFIERQGDSSYLCSATHLAGPRVVTNAHCVERSTDPGDHYVVYYDKTGQKTFATVQSFAYVGNTNKDDVAIVNITDAAAAGWDEAGLGIQPTDNLINQSQTFPVTLWALDPVQGRPDLTSQYGNQGMILSPNHCQAARKNTSVVGIDPSGNRTQIVAANSDPRIHVFYDHCDRGTIGGNSGSLITASDFTLKIGVHHWLMTPSGHGKQTFSAFDIIDTGGAENIFSLSELPNGAFNGVGTVFESDKQRSAAFAGAFGGN